MSEWAFQLELLWIGRQGFGANHECDGVAQSG